MIRHQRSSYSQPKIIVQLIILNIAYPLMRAWYPTMVDMDASSLSGKSQYVSDTKYGVSIPAVDTSYSVFHTRLLEPPATTSALRMGGSVAVDLFSKLDANCHHEVYFDN